MNEFKTWAVSLLDGELKITVKKSRIPLRRLLGFASRQNSKRSFLFVSKILGKHYPVRPRLMAWSYRSLARRILQRQNIGQSSLWIGMAETATGLGYGVYESARASGLGQSLFLQTTRYQLSGCQRLEFIEAHSHATDFFLYWPEDPLDRELFLTAQHLVLIDDEISTGSTFLRLIDQYRKINPQLKTVVVASLVNFASEADKCGFERSATIPVRWVSLLEGQWQFQPAAADRMPARDDSIRVIGDDTCKKAILSWPGRLGISHPITLDPANVAALLAFLPPVPTDHRPLLILGTGECNPPAYLLGRQLERSGLPVIVQATTRSPIHLGADIASKIRFTDNYQDGIDNFLYNIDPAAFRLIVFCHETPLLDEADDVALSFIGLIKQFNGVSAWFSLHKNRYAEFSFHRP
ncbi:MAG: phosphoribosyltransferase domain-containing protein [Methylomonas sp.]|nr:phosphoribosyltransferase domain-containing protein [Methylomonas sp.]PPD22065.1 MAG: hypothetical protein CTY23_03130 [Methylomonas sp.]PPD26155.1 MAG: hypothetical protein CTY22_06215 [Methylomonas sp.]PPD37870.1 MAG: hypothetical protein CTY21_06210 [Methylomonas sp.]PPD42447.1 MAG: hypothetical protein CTY17_01540 [Methylomonas sp.]